NGLHRDLVEDQSVTDVIMGREGRGIAIEHDGFIAERPRFSYGINGAPVKLHTRPNAIAAGTDNQYLLSRRRRDIIALSAIGEVQIIGFSRILCGESVNLRETRQNPVQMSELSHLRLRATEIFRYGVIRASSAFSFTDAVRNIRRKRLITVSRRNLLTNLYQAGNLTDKEWVNRSQARDLLDAHSSGQTAGDGEDPLWRRRFNRRIQISKRECVRI